MVVLKVMGAMELGAMELEAMVVWKVTEVME